MSFSTFFDSNMNIKNHAKFKILLFLVLTKIDISLQQFTITKYEGKEGYVGTLSIIKVIREKR